jgi:7-keto-8-aminopelargonate synthetase-like enzyme|tara:strand:+ start:190 stop:384 length:195 start_codon:yes stop_codon:yes gene_type:complete
MIVKKLVNDKPLWDGFVDVLNEKIEVAQRKLEQETSIEGVYRAQGEIAALRRLTFLRDEINGRD